jgi:hypothetical protein
MQMQPVLRVYHTFKAPPGRTEVPYLWTLLADWDRSACTRCGAQTGPRVGLVRSDTMEERGVLCSPPCPERKLWQGGGL